MESLECPICLRNFDCKDRIPKIVPCGHSICLECLRLICIKENQIKCPLDYKLFQKQPQELASNFIVMQMVQSANEEHRTQCVQHNEKKDLYCKTDNQQLCFKCLQSGHAQHDVVNVNKMLQEIQPQIQEANRQLINEKELLVQKLNLEEQIKGKMEEFNKSHQSKLRTLKQETLGIIENEFNMAENTFQEALQKQQRQVEEDYSKMSERLKIVQQTLNHDKINIIDFLEKINQVEGNQKQQEFQIEKNQMDFQNLVQNMENQLKALQQKYQIANNANEVKNVQLDDKVMKKQLEQLQKENKQVKEENQELKKQLQSLHSKYENYKQMLKTEKAKQIKQKQPQEYQDANQSNLVNDLKENYRVIECQVCQAEIEQQNVIELQCFHLICKSCLAIKIEKDTKGKIILKQNATGKRASCYMCNYILTNQEILQIVGKQKYDKAISEVRI